MFSEHGTLIRGYSVSGWQGPSVRANEMDVRHSFCETIARDGVSCDTCCQSPENQHGA